VLDSTRLGQLLSYQPTSPYTCIKHQTPNHNPNHITTRSSSPITSFSTSGLTTLFQLSHHEFHSQLSPSHTTLTLGARELEGGRDDSRRDVRRLLSAPRGEGKEVRRVSICWDSSSAVVNTSPFLPSLTNSLRL
jgi:hypothetical protein